MADILILLFSITVIALLGATVYLHDVSRSNNRRFAFLSFSLILWAVTNYLSEHSITNALSYTRLTYASGALAIFSVINFMAYFPNQKLFSKNSAIRLYNLFSIVIVFVSLTPLIANSVRPDMQVGAITTGALYPLFLLFVGISMCLLLYIVIAQNKAANAPEEKAQVRIISSGVMIYALVAILANVIIPLLADDWSSSDFGPAFSMILIGFVAYSIVKHRLFDIRLIVAKTVAYALSLALLSTIFVTTSLLLGSLLLPGNVSSDTIIFFAVASVIVALAFQPIKRYFDKISNSIFYRDAYLPQDVLNKVNSALVNTVDLEKLLSATGEIIEKELKVSFAEFYLDPKASIEFHLAGSNNKLFSAKGWNKFLDTFNSAENKVLYTGSTEEKDILPLFKQLDIECAIKMISNDENVGYLLVGARKSGNALTNQDVQLLEIIADEVAIAAQNALRLEEISQFNITLQKKIDDATKQLQKSNDKLKQLDEAKDEFISMASHQLRTPLTSVKGYISMLLEGDAGEINDTQRKFLDQAYVSSQRMVYLIADLLNVSRLKTGKFIIEPQPTYLPDVVESEIAQLYETAKVRELELIYKKPDTFPVLNIDETKIRQVIMNFVDNAIYYTPKGGKITISLKEKPESIEYTVTDTGIGVPKNEQHKLFTKFYRAGNAKKARPDGTGLGLFMAKKVVVAQGGAIVFKTTESKGSTFGFSFPRAKLEVTK